MIIQQQVDKNQTEIREKEMIQQEDLQYTCPFGSKCPDSMYDTCSHETCIEFMADFSNDFTEELYSLGKDS